MTKKKTNGPTSMEDIAKFDPHLEHTLELNNLRNLVYGLKADVERISFMAINNRANYLAVLDKVRLIEELMHYIREECT